MDSRAVISPEHSCCLPSNAERTPSVERSKQSRTASTRTRGLGLAALLLAVGAIFVLNSRTLWAMQAKVRSEQRQAIEASQPAVLELTVVSAAACPQCFDAAKIVDALRANSRLKIILEKNIAADSSEGQSLAQELVLTQWPVVVLKGQIEKALAAADFLKSYGRTAEDGRFVLAALPAPYLEVATGAVRGLVEAIYLTDKACPECYDPTRHRSPLSSVGLVPTTETILDRQAAAGKDLVKEYDIESVPTLLLKGDLGVYQRFQSVWPSVGTIESDGTYVFRSGQSQMGAYYDLKAKKLIKPETKQPESAPAK